MKRLPIALLFILLASPLLCHAAAPGFMQERMGTLSGQVLDDAGKPLTGGGVVSFFKASKGIPPLVADMHRIPDMLGRMETDGKFSVKLAPSTYYMGAMVITQPGRGPGPPRKGEAFYFAQDAKGALLELTIGEKETKNVGKVKGGLPGSFPVYKDLATVEGNILNEEGQPFEGAFVMVKIDMNSARPDYVSPKTGKDGHFVLKVPPGKYYILAREKIIGGRPKVGDLVGVFGKDSLLGGGLPGTGVERLGPGIPDQSQWEKGIGEKEAAGADAEKNSIFSSGLSSIQAGSEAIAVELAKGASLTGIDIIMYKVPDPIGTRDKFMKEGGQKEGESPEFPAPFTPEEKGK